MFIMESVSLKSLCEIESIDYESFKTFEESTWEDNYNSFLDSSLANVDQNKLVQSNISYVLILRMYHILIKMQDDIDKYNNKAKDIELSSKINRYENKNEEHIKQIRSIIDSNDQEKMNNYLISIMTPQNVLKELLYYELRHYHIASKVSLTDSNKDEVSKMVKHELDRFYLLGQNYFESQEWEVHFTSTPIIRIPNNYIIFTNTITEEASDNSEFNGLDVHLSMLSEFLKRFYNNKIKVCIKPDRKMYFDWALVVIQLM